MFRKQKIETINFKTFLAGNRVKRSKCLANNSIYGFMPSITISSFFSMSPEIAGLYAVVIGVGALGMLSHCLEVTAASSGHEAFAEAIETITRLVLTIGGFGFIALFLFSL